MDEGRENCTCQGLLEEMEVLLGAGRKLHQVQACDDQLC